MSEATTIGSTADKVALLSVARRQLESSLGLSGSDAEEPSPVEGTYGGAFVTLWSSGRLRGCIGQFVRTSDLCALVREVTKGALSDPRFGGDRVSADEAGRINIEVSVLSDLQSCDDPMSIVPGVHGVVVRSGLRSGCFLPKVATEHGWDTATLLGNCCRMKAGLAEHAWQDPKTEVSTFTADVFSESEVMGR